MIYELYCNSVEINNLSPRLRHELENNAMYSR